MDWLLLRLLLSNISTLSIFSRCKGWETLGESIPQQWGIILSLAYLNKWFTQLPLSGTTLQILLESCRETPSFLTQEFDWESLLTTIPQLIPISKEEVTSIMPAFKSRMFQCIARAQEQAVYKKLEDSDHFKKFEMYYTLARELNGIEDADLNTSYTLFPEHFNQIVTDDLKGYHENAMPTGFPTLDRILRNGMRPSEVYGIMANPKSGKSSFVFSLAANIACQYGKQTLILETDMPHISTKIKITQIIYHRVFSSAPSFDDLHNFIPRIQQEMNGSGTLGHIGVKNFTGGELTISKIDSLLTNSVFPWDMVIIDSFDRMGITEAPIKDRWEKEDWIINQLIDVARRFKIALWVPYQPKKDAARKGIKEDYDVRGSYEKIFRSDAWFALNGGGAGSQRCLEAVALRNAPPNMTDIKELSVPIEFDRFTGRNWEKTGGAKASYTATENRNLSTSEPWRPKEANLISSGRG